MEIARRRILATVRDGDRHHRVVDDPLETPHHGVDRLARQGADVELGRHLCRYDVRADPARHDVRRDAVAEHGVEHGDARQHARAALFFFNDTAPTEIYTLSLHDALPI